MSDSYYIESGEGVLSELGVDFFSQDLVKGNIVFSHIHPAIEILIFDSGSGKVSLEDEVISVAEGDMLLIRANVVHRISSDGEENLKYFVLKVHPRLLFDFSAPSSGAVYSSFFSSQNSSGNSVFRIEEKPELKSSYLRLKASLTSLDDCRDFERKVAAAELLLSLYRIGKKSAPHAEHKAVGGDMVRGIYDAILYIKEHFTENITAAECAAYINVSYSYFSRIFKKVTGKNFSRYLNILRINLAEEKLKIGNKPITEIAQDCGFTDSSYFISVYRSLRGRTPLSERKNNAGNISVNFAEK